MRRFTVPDTSALRLRREVSVIGGVIAMMLGCLAFAEPALATYQNPVLHLAARYCADAGVRNGTGRLTISNPNTVAIKYYYTVKSTVKTYTGSATVSAKSSVSKLFTGMPAGAFTAKVTGGGTSVGPIKASIPTCPKVSVGHAPPDWSRYTVAVKMYDQSRVSVTFKITTTGNWSRSITVQAGYSLGAEVPLKHTGTTTVSVYSSGHLRGRWSFTHS